MLVLFAFSRTLLFFHIIEMLSLSSSYLFLLHSSLNFPFLPVLFRSLSLFSSYPFPILLFNNSHFILIFSLVIFSLNCFPYSLCHLLLIIILLFALLTCQAFISQYNFHLSLFLSFAKFSFIIFIPCLHFYSLLFYLFSFSFVIVFL